MNVTCSMSERIAYLDLIPNLTGIIWGTNSIKTALSFLSKDVATVLAVDQDFQLKKKSMPLFE